jgi:hypothetical protein
LADHARRSRILVLGGAGFYGQYVVRDLLRTSGAQLVVASRNPEIQSIERRVSTATIDITDTDALRRLAQGVDVIVHCAGPFTRLPLHPVDVAIDLGLPYVDIAEDRAFAKAVRLRQARAIASRVPLLTGMSVCPAMEALAIRHLQPAFDSVSALRTYAAPDTKRHRGPAMFETMLFGAGRRFEHPNANRGRDAYGWTEPEWFDLPPPIGRRLTFRIHDMADVDLLPATFGLEYVAFKAGSEWPALNTLVGLAAQVRRRTGHPDWTHIARPARALSRIIGRGGREEGGVAFELTGLKGGTKATASVAITAEHHGGRIPSLLASMATQEILTGRYSSPGVADIAGWIDPDRWLEGMSTRGLSVWHRPDRSSPWADRRGFPANTEALKTS